MKADKYYKADLELTPSLKNSLIGRILNIKEVLGLEVGVYSSGEVRFLIIPKRAPKPCLKSKVESLCGEVFSEDRCTVTVGRT